MMNRGRKLGQQQVRSKRLLILCPYPVGVAASQRLKYEQYLDDWRGLGFSIDISPFINLSTWEVLYVPGRYFQKIIGTLFGTFQRCRDLLRIARYDLVYVHMWVTPLGTNMYERAVRKLARRLIYDIEDNVVVRQQEARGTFHPNSLIAFLRGTSKARFLVRYADCVITSSPFLNDYCLQINETKNCVYISSSVDSNRFLPVTSRSNKSRVVIGWTGTFSSKIYLDSLRGVFQKLADRVEFKLKIIGNFDYELHGIDIQVETWSADAEIQQLQDIDIGIYPLPKNIWALGKSGLKAIQYMACGLPTVASRVGTTPLLISHDVEGLLVESEEEWIDSLERLIRDPELRRRLGDAARKKAVQKYSINSVKYDYRQVLSTFLDERTQ